MLRKSLAVLVTAGFAAACATTVATVGFPAADANDDNMLTRAEFTEFFDDTDAYERYDDNDDGNLSRMEYNEAVASRYEGDAYFRGLDRDSNGSLTRMEFIDGWFGMFDTDRSGNLSRSEFENALDGLELEL